MTPGPKPYTWERVISNIMLHIKTGAPDECWEWTAARTPAGYGIVQARAFSKMPLYVHRIILAMKIGRDLKENEEAIHICDNPSCNNPKHLIVGSHADNMHDAQDKGRLKIGGRTSGTLQKRQCNQKQIKGI